MKKIVFILLISSFAAATVTSCSSSGHKAQSWHPKTGKRPQAGHNR